MTLVEELLKADAKKADELKLGTFKSERLAEILGKKNSVDVQIREIKSRRLNDIITYPVDRKGSYDFSKNFEMKLMTCVEGIVNPDVKNKELQAHFGVDNGRELVEKLFGSEVTAIADAISELSGIKADAEEEVKN